MWNRFSSHRHQPPCDEIKLNSSFSLKARGVASPQDVSLNGTLVVVSLVCLAGEVPADARGLGPVGGSAARQQHLEVLYRVGAGRRVGHARGQLRLLLAALEHVPEAVGRVAEGVHEEHLGQAEEEEAW